MATKTAKVYTLDELKEKCQGALTDPKLVEIVETAPLNKDGKVNLSWVYKQAEDYVHGETKELAVETRFLAMLRRDFAEEFEELVFCLKPKEMPKNDFSQKEFRIPSSFKLGVSRYGGGFIQFITPYEPFQMRHIKSFGLEILKAVMEEEPNLRDDSEVMDGLRNDLIQLFEEKFGLRVKFCFNCEKSSYVKSWDPDAGVWCSKYNNKCSSMLNMCKDWASKKKEN